MSSLKETIAEVISQHIALEDTYTYELTRTKSAFEVGTMSLEDFEEWTEENVADLAKAIVGVLQPQLNENQQIVLDWLKSRSKGGNSPFAVVQGFRGFNGVPSLEINSLISLSIAEESQVLEVFSRWVQEQEAE